MYLASVGIPLCVGLQAPNLSTGEKQVTHSLNHLYSIHDAHFAQTMGNMPGPAIIGGNRFATLLNGDEIFPSMLQAIKGAQKTITFETSIYWSGEIGKAFADALSQRARDGVKVHVLLDWLGSSKMDKAFLAQMRDAGVHIRRYHEPRWYNPDQLNNRTHRTELCVDGRTGLTGGGGIASESVRQELQTRRFDMEAKLRARFERAKTDGDIRPDVDTDSLTSYVLALAQCMALQASMGMGLGAMRKVVAIALQAWPCGG